MMTCFYLSPSVYQIILLVFSQLTVIMLIGNVILLFKRRCNPAKRLGVLSVLLLNITLYVLMQLDNRITGAEQSLHLHVPYGVLLLVTLLSSAFNIWALLSETRNRKTISLLASTPTASLYLPPTGYADEDAAGKNKIRRGPCV